MVSKEIEFTLQYERSDRYATYDVDGFTIVRISMGQRTIVQLTGTTDQVRTTAEKFKATVDEETSKVTQTGDRTFQQTPVKVEEVMLRMTPDLTVDLLKLLIRNLDHVAPDSIAEIKSEVEKLGGATKADD